jgi:acylphosphatase
MVNVQEGFLQKVVQKTARKYGLEGVAQLMGGQKVKIVVCGVKEHVDSFVDIIHKELEKPYNDTLEIEPFLKDRDYRGVFRIIE